MGDRGTVLLLTKNDQSDLLMKVTEQAVLRAGSAILVRPGEIL